MTGTAASTNGVAAVNPAVFLRKSLRDINFFPSDSLNGTPASMRLPDFQLPQPRMLVPMMTCHFALFSTFGLSAEPLYYTTVFFVSVTARHPSDKSFSVIYLPVNPNKPGTTWKRDEGFISFSITDPIDGSGAVIGYQQRSVGHDEHIHRASPGLIPLKPAFGEHLIF